MSSLALMLVASLLAATTLPLGQWTIHSDRPEEQVIALVRDLLPKAQGELEQKLGLKLLGRATLVLCGSTESFRRATPGVDHRHTLGVAYPSRRAVFVNCEAIEAQPFEHVAITLRHELSHLLVGEAVRRGHPRVPLWFDEGVAVWTSGKVPRYDVRDYRRAVASGALRPLAELADSFPLDPFGRGVAYEQSESVVRFLVTHHGEEAVRAILRAAVDGVPFDEAVRQAIREDLATLEQKWLESERPAFPWLSWIVNTFSLFGLMSLFAVFAFWVYWRRRQRRYRQWDMEESYYGSEDSPWV
jgi:hypothetical protein